MHGVHPTAKAIPSGSAAAGPGLTFDSSGRPSRYIHAIPRRSAYRSMNAPRSRTSTPAVRCPALDRSHLDRALAVDPATTVNTRLNPRMNSRIGTNVERFDVGSPAAV